MRLTILTLIATLGLAASTLPAGAAPVVPTPGADHAAIVKVWGGCGPGFHPVPGHWSYRRGVWIPPHCAPHYRPYGPYAGGPYGPYSGWRPYWGWHRYY